MAPSKDLDVFRVADFCVVVTLFVLGEDAEDWQLGFVGGQRNGQLVLAQPLEVDHGPVEGPVVRVAERIASRQLCRQIAEYISQATLWQHKTNALTTLCVDSVPANQLAVNL